MTLRVLLVEDDRELRRTLGDVLTLEGHLVRTAASCAEALALLTHGGSHAGDAGTDLVLLDLGLPDGDGAEVLAAVRRQHALPVIVISARDADAGKIALLDQGADDYLVKPFAVGELLARMRVALRHRGTTLRPAVTRWHAQDVTVDLATPRVERNGAELHLTPTELRLLARLVRSAGQVVTHRQLLADVWGPDCVEHTHYLRLYMSQLRAKLEADPAEPTLLLTEPGLGYRLTEGDG